MEREKVLNSDSHKIVTTRKEIMSAVFGSLILGFFVGAALMGISNYDKLYSEEDFSPSLVAVCDQNSGECQTLNVGNRLLVHEQVLGSHRNVIVNHEERLQNIEELIRQNTQEVNQ